MSPPAPEAKLTCRLVAPAGTAAAEIKVRICSNGGPYAARIVGIRPYCLDSAIP